MAGEFGSSAAGAESGGSAAIAHARMRYGAVGGMVTGQQQAEGAGTAYTSAGDAEAAAGGNRGMMGMMASALASSPLVAALLSQLGKKKEGE
jgi:hypothetical protein